MIHLPDRIWMPASADSSYRAHQPWRCHHQHQLRGYQRNDVRALHDKLNAQQNEYTLETVAPEGTRDDEK